MKAIGCLITGIVLTVVALLILAFLQDRDAASEETYHAWMHAHPNSTLTYPEWKRLEQHDMLDGQTKYETIILPQPVYVH